MESIITYFSGTLGLAELVATILLVINVYLLAKQKVINFLYGSIGVIIFGWIFYKVQLYSDMLLQWAYFLPIQIFSAWYWIKKKPSYNKELPVITLTTGQRILVLLAIVGTSLALGYGMATFTNAAFPYWDALTTMMSVIAQYLMIKKYWESWVIWITMDVIAINIYFLKGLMVTSGLYVMFLFLASYGLYKWYTARQNKPLIVQMEAA